MVDASGQQVPTGQWLYNRLLVKLWDTIIGWLIVAFVGFCAWLLFDPIKERLIQIWNLPDTVRQYNDDMRVLRDSMMQVTERVRRLSFPNQVFQISVENSGPIAGYCVEGAPCQVRLRIRRLEMALSCEFVAGSTQWAFINPRSDTVVSATRLDKPAGRNIGASWQDIDVSILTPAGLAPSADFFFEASYTGCPGMVAGDDPITLRSERDKYTILRAPPKK